MQSRVLSTLEKRSSGQYQLSLQIDRYPLALGLIVAGGILFKLVFLGLYAGPMRMYQAVPPLGILGNDSVEYYTLALTIKRSFAYHSVLRTPGYPAFLALIYAATRDPNPLSPLNLTAVYTVQSVLMTLGCLPLAGAVRRLTGLRSLALIAALIWAFHNSARYYSHWLITEPLAAILICCLAYSIVRALKPDEAVRALKLDEAKPVDPPLEGSPFSGDELLGARLSCANGSASPSGPKMSAFWCAVTGALMFALTLVRPSCSLLAIPVGGGMLYTYLRLYRGRRQGFVLALLLLAFPLSSQNLWAWRNYAVEGQWYYCRLSMVGIYTYCFAVPIAVSQGMAPSDTWGIHSPAFLQADSEFWVLLNRLSPRAMDRMYRDRMWDLLKQHPWVVIAHYLGSIPHLFTPALTPRCGLDQANELQQLKSPGYWLTLPWDQRAVHALALLNSLAEVPMTWGLLALLLAGVISRRRWPDAAQQGVFITVGLAFIYWILVHATTVRYNAIAGGSRFLFPFIPLLILGAADAMVRLYGASPIYAKRPL